MLEWSSVPSWWDLGRWGVPSRSLVPALLILGSRFPSSATGPDPVAAAGPWVDVVSVNDYEVDDGALNLFRRTGGELFAHFFLDDPFSGLDEIHRLTGKPVMITEYSYRTPTPDGEPSPHTMPGIGTQTH